MQLSICDIGGSGIRIKHFIKKGNQVLQKDEIQFDIEFHEYISSFDDKNIYLKRSNKILGIVKKLNNCYVGATAGVRSVVKKAKKYNVYMNNKFLFELNILSSKKEAELEFKASKYKFKDLESMLSMGSRSSQIFNDNKAYSVNIGFKTPNKNSSKFNILKNKKILGISSLYWAAKKIEKKMNRKLADNTRGVKINSKFIEKLSSIDLSDFNEKDKNQILVMKKMLKQIVGENTIIIFKREWVYGDSKYVINWCTGKALEL